MPAHDAAIHPDAVEIQELDRFPNHNAIWDMTADPAGRVYIGLCNEGEPGHAAKLLAYESTTRQVRELFDVAEATHDPSWRGHIPQSKFHTCMAVGGDGRFYAATHTTAPSIARPLWDIEQAYDEREIAYPGSHYLIYDPRTERVEDLGIPVPRDSVYGGVYDDERGVHYLLTFLRGRLYAFTPATGGVRDLGRVTSWGQCILFKDRHGRIFGVEGSGHLWRYTPETDTVEGLSAVMPRPAARAGYHTALSEGCWGPDMKFYSTALYEGRLWRYDPDDGPDGRFEDLGMGWGEAADARYQNLLWCPLFDRDGRLYYGFATYGGATDCRYFDLRIIHYDPQSGRRENLGIVHHQGSSLLFGAGATGADGRLYWGDSCRYGRPAALVILDPARLGATPGPRVTLTPKPQNQGGAGPRKEEWLARLSERSANCACDPSSLRLVRLYRRLLPRGACAVTALTATDGRVCAATSGTSCHLLAIGADATVIGRYPRQGQVIGLASSAGRLWAAIALPSPRGRSMLAGFTPGSPLPSALHPVPGRLLAMAAADAGRVILLAGSRLLQFDTGDGTLTPLAELPEPPCPVLAADGHGSLWGALAEGFLYRLRLETGAVQVLEQRIPASRGSHYMASWESAAIDAGGLIYGGTNEGYLFRFDPLTGRVANLGKPVRAPGIRALTVTGRGAVYGMAGAPDELARLFRYLPEEGFTDLGRPSLPDPDNWKGHRFAAILAHGDEIYLGEDDTESHLWVLKELPCHA